MKTLAIAIAGAIIFTSPVNAKTLQIRHTPTSTNYLVPNAPYFEAYGLTAPNSAGPGKPQQHEGHIRSCDRRKPEIHRGVERCPSRDDG